MFELNQQQQQLEQFVEQSKRTENTTNRFRIMDITIFSSITRRANTQLREFNTGYCYSDVHRKHIKARFEYLSSLSYEKGNHIKCDSCMENIEFGYLFFIHKRKSFNKYYHPYCADNLHLI